MADTTTPTSLLPCPFCGSDARISRARDESLWSHAEVIKTCVRCDGCDIATDYTEEGQDPEAIEKWNRRASPAPQELPPVQLPEDERKREFYTGICVALTVIKSTDAVAWAEIVRACGDGLIYHAAHIEPSEWEVAGFDKHLWSELRKRKPRAIAADRRAGGR